MISVFAVLKCGQSSIALREPPTDIYTRDLCERPPAATKSVPRVSVRKKIVPANAPNVVERVRSILASVGLTLSQASQRAANVFGHSSPFFFPHTLYYQLRRESFSPSLHQVFALSAISGYRFSDWLRVFGFNLEDLATLQISLPSKRTILLDSSWTDSQACGLVASRSSAQNSGSRDCAACRTTRTVDTKANRFAATRVTLPLRQNRHRRRARLSGSASRQHRSRESRSIEPAVTEI